MKVKFFIFLLSIVALGAVLRLFSLSSFPPSLNWDEVSHGFNAYSILKTGMDEWGQKFPLINFRAYGDYPLPLNLYLTVPFIAIFGLTEFAIRFPHALLGILTIISVFFLTYGLTKRKTVSLIAAFLTAVSPWSVFTSRFVIQANLAIFLLTSALALFFNRDKRKSFLPLSLVFLFLTLFAYHTTRIFSPLLLLVLVLIYGRRIFNRFLAVLVIFFFIISILILKSPESRARSGFLFLIDQAAVNKIIEARDSSPLPSWAKRLIYNRPVYFVKEFSKNYVSYFSPRFLFFQGGTQYQFSVPNQGLIYWLNLPFFYLGLAFIILQALRGNRDYKLILFWLLLAPIPAAITNEFLAVLRSSTLLPLPFLAIALGIERFSGKNWVIPAYVVLSLLSLENYLSIYFTDYRINYSWAWQYGYEEVINYAKENYPKYDKIIVTKKYGEPHEFFLFFWPWDPAKYRSDPNLIRFNQSNWYWVDRFDKFYFVNDWQMPRAFNEDFVLESGGNVKCQMLNVKCLLITSPGNYPAGWGKLETVNFLDGKPAFEMYEN